MLRLKSIGSLVHLFIDSLIDSLGFIAIRRSSQVPAIYLMLKLKGNASPTKEDVNSALQEKGIDVSEEKLEQFFRNKDGVRVGSKC